MQSYQKKEGKKHRISPRSTRTRSQNKGVGVPSNHNDHTNIPEINMAEKNKEDLSPIERLEGMMETMCASIKEINGKVTSIQSDITVIKEKQDSNYKLLSDKLANCQKENEALKIQLGRAVDRIDTLEQCYGNTYNSMERVKKDKKVNNIIIRGVPERDNERMHDLKLLTKWCRNNRLTVNINKTKVMLFGTKNMLKRGKRNYIFINETKLQYVNQFNYLGIKLDCSLTFELHAAESLRMVAHKLYLMGRIRKFITTEQAITIYKSKIVPYFDYGDIFLMNITSKTKQKLQKVQNRGLRICMEAEGRTNVNFLHNTCNVNKLDDRRSTHLLNFVYNRAQKEEYCQTGPRALRRYNAPILKEVKSNNKNFERSILYQGALHWNNLDVETRGAVTPFAFKKGQKSGLNLLLPYG